MATVLNVILLGRREAQAAGEGDAWGDSRTVGESILPTGQHPVEGDISTVGDISLDSVLEVCGVIVNSWRGEGLSHSSLLHLWKEEALLHGELRVLCLFLWLWHISDT